MTCLPGLQLSYHMTPYLPKLAVRCKISVHNFAPVHPPQFSTELACFRSSVPALCSGTVTHPWWGVECVSVCRDNLDGFKASESCQIRLQ
jgi:hypothetical protein